MEDTNKTSLTPDKLKVITLDSKPAEKGKGSPNGKQSNKVIPAQADAKELVSQNNEDVETDESFDIEKSIEEIQTLVSNLQKDQNIKNANISKLETAISVGKIIIKIHNNVKNKEMRSKINNKIKTILGRERSTIQDYKRLTYFEDTITLASLGIASAAKVCGHLRNYNKITNNTFLNIKDVLAQIDNERCKNEDSLLQFEEEISNKSSSVFCKEIVLKEASEKFGNNIELTIPKKFGIKVGDAKEIISSLDKYDLETFKDVIEGIAENIDQVYEDKKIEQIFRKHIEALRVFVNNISNSKFNTAINAFEDEVMKLLNEKNNE